MDAKDIQAVMKLCRKYGVTLFDTPNLTMKFGDLPKGKEDDADPESPDELTPEQIMYFSAGGTVP